MEETERVRVAQPDGEIRISSGGERTTYRVRNHVVDVPRDSLGAFLRATGGEVVAGGDTTDDEDQTRGEVV